MDREKEQYLHDIYYNPKHPGSYWGPYKLYQVVREEAKFKITLKQVTDWFRKQEVYSTHVQPTRKFKRVKMVSRFPLDILESDVAHMNPDWAEENGGMLAFMVTIDIFSKKLWTRALSSKTSKDVIQGIKTVFNEKKPLTLRTDRCV
jgi:hypothetical protein